MIDPKALPLIALLDSDVLIGALGGVARDHKDVVAKEFWEAMLKEGRRLLIAAPTLTEVTRGSKYPPLRIPSTRQIKVVPFDHEAARILAKQFPETVITNRMADGIFRDYLRYDAMILACAIRFKATFVTAEAPLSKLAIDGGVDCKRVQDFEGTPSRQLQLGGLPESV